MSLQRKAKGILLKEKRPSTPPLSQKKKGKDEDVAFVRFWIVASCCVRALLVSLRVGQTVCEGLLFLYLIGEEEQLVLFFFFTGGLSPSLKVLCLFL